MTTRGLIKATAVFNNFEARKDWRDLLYRVTASGFDDLAKTFAAGFDSRRHSWRKIDRRMINLRASYELRRRRIRMIAGLPAQPRKDGTA